MDMAKTGQYIAQARKEKGLTQQQLAEALNITGAAVSKWERGLSFPDVSLLEPLTMILDVSVIELLQGERQAEAQISTAEAEQRVRDALHLIMDDLEQSRVPKAVQRFFAPQYYQKALAMVLFVVGFCLVVTGVILALVDNPEGIELVIWGISIALLAFLLWVWGRMIIRRNKRLVQSGTRITATATRIRQNYYTDMPFQKNTHPYFIDFQYLVDGRLYKGHSPMIWERPELTSKDVPVYIDSAHPRRHYMDVDC